MALKEVWADPARNQSYPDAYHRVAGIELALDDDDPKVNILVVIYVDQATRDDGKAPFAQRNIGVANEKAVESLIGEKDAFRKRFGDVVLVGNGQSPVKAAYTYMKKHPLYKTAVDV